MGLWIHCSCRPVFPSTKKACVDFRFRLYTVETAVLEWRQCNWSITHPSHHKFPDYFQRCLCLLCNTISTSQEDWCNKNMAKSKMADCKIAKSKMTESKIADSNMADSKMAESKITESKMAESKMAESRAVTVKKLTLFWFYIPFIGMSWLRSSSDGPIYGNYINRYPGPIYQP